MKKNFWNNFFIGILAMGLIAGCNNDEWDGNGTDPEPELNDAVYMNVQVQLPVAGAGTRSKTDTGKDDDYGTSTDGTEVGKDYENEVKRVLLVLAQKSTDEEIDNKIIGVSYNENSSNIKVEGSTLQATHSISKSALKTYYTANGGTTDDTSLTPGKEKIKIYVFCNPVESFVNEIKTAANDGDTDWVNKTAGITEKPNVTMGGDAAIWGGVDHKNGFLMSVASAKDIEKMIPKTLSEWSKYTTVSSPFLLSGVNNPSSDDAINNEGSIRVERSVARFDFKDGSGNDNTYDVISGKIGEGADETLVRIQLQKMALVNMSKKFYYLRRVSDDGTATNALLCGTETSKNYVVDTDASEKSAFDLSKFEFADHFNFCLGHVDESTPWTIDEVARNQWYSVKIDDVTKNDADNWGEKEYHIWRYVTENTIPGGTNGELQRNGISTGIVFKGKMLATEAAVKGTELGKAIEGATGNSDKDPILYSYEDKLYVKWTEVRKVAIAEKETHPFFYRAVFGTPTEDCIPAAEDADKLAVYSDDENSADYYWGRWQDEKVYPNTESEQREEAKKNFKKYATTAKFTIYQSSMDEDNNPGYFCYYYYWNRHNDNNDNGAMGPMEFAVVRNNVYKLAVTGIKKLGHPRISENDPDSPEEDKKDEEEDVYLSVDVQVLPWVVRVNNIEF